MAEHIGCSLITVQKLEAGDRRPSKPMAVRIAHCLHVPDGGCVAYIVFARPGRSAAPVNAWGATLPRAGDVFMRADVVRATLRS